MGILLVYDVTDEASFNNIRNWIRNIEQNASDNVNRILIGRQMSLWEKMSNEQHCGRASYVDYCT